MSKAMSDITQEELVILQNNINDYVKEDYVMSKYSLDIIQKLLDMREQYTTAQARLVEAEGALSIITELSSGMRFDVYEKWNFINELRDINLVAQQALNNIPLKDNNPIR